jgi:hypothetical protein
MAGEVAPLDVVERLDEGSLYGDDLLVARRQPELLVEVLRGETRRTTPERNRDPSRPGSRS